MNEYLQLEKFFTRMNALDHASAILSWDESVMMPAQSGVARAAAQSELHVIKHEILINPELLELLQKVEENASSLHLWEQANFREMKKIILRAHAVKKDLVEAYSLAASECQQAWRIMRGENNWKDFLPLFEKLLLLARAEAQQRSQTMGMTGYDCLLDQFSPGITSSEISKIFNQVKSFLPALTQEIIDHQKSDPSSTDLPPIPIHLQKNLGLSLIKNLGFDMSKGRLDTSHHPFCGGVPQDIRMTTRYNISNFMESMMGTMHETGHALYEQNLPTKWNHQPVGMARGMDIHESQSLFFENCIGRNKHFFKFLFPVLETHLFKGANIPSPQRIFNLFNTIKRSFIRVNADEVTYPMHIILRYEIESDLISGKLEAKDLPEVWDFKMQTYLGLSTKDDFKNGCMQDVHWPSGAFGYFPSYSLGSILASQLFYKIKQSDPNFVENLTQGNLNFIKGWLNDKIWSQGSLLTSQELIFSATGESLNPSYFKNYLKEKYLE